MSQITVKPWTQLTADEFFEIAKLRSEVFFVEQRIDVPDFDDADRDPKTLHWWISDERGCAAYLRSLQLPAPEHGARSSFGRVAVRSDRRGEGLGRALVAATVDRFGNEPMVIHSQSYIVPLYTGFGFEPLGPEFFEAGIAHRTMVRPGQIHVSAVILTDAAGRVLMVRKRGTTSWFNPGGKPEPGETAAECAVREAYEELGIELDPSTLIPLGRRQAAAANEPGVIVVADVLQAPTPLLSQPQPRAEIEQTRFVDPAIPEPTWSPLFTNELRQLIRQPGSSGNP